MLITARTIHLHLIADFALKFSQTERIPEIWQKGFGCRIDGLSESAGFQNFGMDSKTFGIHRADFGSTSTTNLATRIILTLEQIFTTLL